MYDKVSFDSYVNRCFIFITAKQNYIPFRLSGTIDMRKNLCASQN
jgi:hypothetical protein